MSGLFITGAGTEIGKTFITCALADQLQKQGRAVQVFKPIITGYNPDRPQDSDSGKLLETLRVPPTDDNVAEISPWRYETPVAPSMAARIEERAIDLGEVVAFCREALEDENTFTLIEGVGGVMAPITETSTVVDWMMELGCPALLVSGSYLGAISHALTAASVLAERKVNLIGVVVSESNHNPVPLKETTASIGQLLPGQHVTGVPRVPSYRDAPDLLHFIEFSLKPRHRKVASPP
jgi:dethiobiotin synthetase